MVREIVLAGETMSNLGRLRNDVANRFEPAEPVYSSTCVSMAGVESCVVAIKECAQRGRVRARKARLILECAAFPICGLNRLAGL